jgi:rod shape-determining protein MreD
MQPKTVQPLNPAVWLLAPALACAAASLVLATPIRIFGFQAPEPVFGVVPAFAWAVVRPSVLAPVILLTLGLFLDLLWGAPLGVWALCLLVVHGLALTLRPALSGQEFWTLGACYGAACLPGFAAALLLSTLASGEVPSLIGLALQMLVTLALYPLVWAMIARFEEADVRIR